MYIYNINTCNVKHFISIMYDLCCTKYTLGIYNKV